MTGDLPGLLMRVLYLIFVLCVGALLWAAFAAARYIRRHESNKPERLVEPIQLAETPRPAEEAEAALRTGKAHYE